MQPLITIWNNWLYRQLWYSYISNKMAFLYKLLVKIILTCSIAKNFHSHIFSEWHKNWNRLHVKKQWKLWGFWRHNYILKGGSPWMLCCTVFGKKLNIRNHFKWPHRHCTAPHGASSCVATSKHFHTFNFSPSEA